VLGFTRAEISLILLGELGAILLIAVPAGLLLGYALAALVVLSFDTELYRFPLGSVDFRSRRPAPAGPTRSRCGFEDTRVGVMNIRPGRLTLWGAAALLLALLVWSFRPQPIPVDLAAVQRGNLRVTIDEEGMTRVRERYVVSAPVAGRLQRVELEPGDTVVARRTVVATFLPATPSLLDTRTRAETEARMKAAQAARDQARVALQRSRDELAFSQTELARQRQLAKIDAITVERMAAIELDARNKEAQLKAAELALQAAEHELEAARAVLQQVASPIAARPTAGNLLSLRSPIDGIVLRVHQESEALVPAGTPLIEVGNPDQLEIVADFLSTDAVKLQPGYPVLIDGWGGEKTLQGRVRIIEPAGFTKISALGVEEQRVNVLIDFEGTRAHLPKLGDGYRVEVSVIIWERSGVLKIPTSALFRVGNDWAVFAVRDGKAAQVAVQIGQRNAIEAEVRSGLSEGDAVILHPGDTVDDGVSVIRR
jgi:HlyD family secretion protein